MSFVRLAIVISAFWLAGAAPDSRSIYNLDAAWVSQDGKATHLAAFAGEPVVLAMIYTTCRTACPLTVSYMKRLRQRMPPSSAARYVLVSLDAAHDTPSTLRDFAEKHRLDLGRWTLLSGGAEDVRDLASALDVRFKTERDGAIAHTPAVFVLDRAGVVREHVQDLAADPEQVAAKTGRL
jgi:protein SCO1/2